jgi:two-component system response regulator RegA
MTNPWLLVDDDVPFRERLARALMARGATVVTAESREAAQAAIGRTTFSAAIVDLRLPDGSGLELVRFLKGHDAKLRVVVLTGFGSIATAMEAVRLGALDYLTKPVDPDQLMQVLVTGKSLRTESKSEVPEAPTLDRVEWEHIQRILADCAGNISQAARVLGIDRRSLQRKLAKYPPAR